MCDWSDGYETEWSFFNERTVKAKKEHICYECGTKIKPKDMYVYTAGSLYGAFFTFKTCNICDEIRSKCSGSYGNLIREIKNAANSDFSFLEDNEFSPEALSFIISILDKMED